MHPAHRVSEPLRTLALSYLASTASLISGTVPLREALELFKIAMTWQTIEQESLSMEDAAVKLELSSRWLYKYRGLFKKLQDVRNELPLHTAVRDFYFVYRQDKGGTVDECLAHLRHHGITKKRILLENLLELYRREGYLAKDGAVYRWKGGPQHISETAMLTRGARAAGVTELLSHLLRRYVETEDGCLRQVRVTLTRSAYEELAVEVKAALDEAVKRALVKSLEADPEQRHPDSVVVDGILILGSTLKKP